MARPVKCPSCNISFDRDKEEWVRHNKRYYHKACFEREQQESNDYKRLISYICRVRGWRAPKGFVLKQIKDFNTINGYSYHDIYMTLFYMYEIKKEPIPQNETIGIGSVDYRIEEASRYFRELQKVMEHNSKQKVDNSKKVIKVPLGNRKRKSSKQKINLEELL